MKKKEQDHQDPSAEPSKKGFFNNHRRTPAEEEKNGIDDVDQWFELKPDDAAEPAKAGESGANELKPQEHMTIRKRQPGEAPAELDTFSIRMLDRKSIEETEAAPKVAEDMPIPEEMPEKPDEREQGTEDKKEDSVYENRAEEKEELVISGKSTLPKVRKRPTEPEPVGEGTSGEDEADTEDNEPEAEIPPRRVESKRRADQTRSGGKRAGERPKRRASGVPPMPDKPYDIEPRRVPPERRYRRSKWWAGPMAMLMMALLVMLGTLVAGEVRNYANFSKMKRAVNRQTFYPGVSMEGVDLSGMTLEQAKAEWGAREKKAMDALNISFELDDRTWNIDANSLGYHSDYEQVLEGAWAVGRYGTLEERYEIVNKLSQENWKRDFKPTRDVDEKKALEKLTAFSETLSHPAVDATVNSFNAEDKTFTFTQSKSGLFVDPNELLKGIEAAAASGAKTVNITRHVVEPKETPKSLAQTYGLISTASTDASSSNNNRLTNLNVACKKLNGYRVEPGAIFSFNEVLGKRTTKAGYRPAGAIENGLTTNQIGGGICQVSTTLFNAAAKADMKIVERAPHSRPSAYIGLGKDAVVNWPDQDFKFMNTSDQPIYITAELTKKRKVNMAVYGKKLPGGMKIEIESETNHTYQPTGEQVIKDPSLPAGERVVVEEARRGYEATTYRVYLNSSGKQMKKVQLGKSYYAPAGAVVRLGTGATAKPSATPEAQDAAQ